jgi:hypothetical protein
VEHYQKTLGEPAFSSDSGRYRVISLNSMLLDDQTVGLDAQGSRNGAGIAAVCLALFVSVMGKIMAKGLGQDVSKVAEPKRRLRLPGFVAFLLGPKENQDGQVKD